MMNDGMNVGGDSGLNQTESANPVVSTETSQVSSEGQNSSAVAPVGEGQPSIAPVVATAPAPVVPPAYQPNFKYKAFQEEKEFPDWSRSIVTSKEHEEHLRSLLCKADGLDGLKPKHQELRGQYQDLAGRWNTLRDQAENDLQGFFKSTGITRERLVDWLIEQDKIESDPRLKQASEAQRVAQQKHQEIEHRFTAQQQQMESMMAQSHQMQLRSVVNDPDVGAFAKAFDDKLGEGAFLAHVYNVGNSHYLETKQNMSPAEATAIVIRQYHKLVGDAPQAPAIQGANRGVSSDGMPVVAPAKPIPSLGNGAAATGRPKIKSLDDIKRLAESLG
jgi:hypothetical protein